MSAKLSQIELTNSGSTGGVTSNRTYDPGGYPTSYTARGWTFAIHKEGEGNGKKSYTCGPSATRNMVQAMTGRDYGELQFEQWEGTTSSVGTYIGNIVSTLNGHFSAYGGWTLKTPTSTTDLRNAIIVDTAGYNQSVILNVRTGYLSFFNGKYLNHYDVAQGYTATTIQIAEEWDPIYIYGSSSYGNPYGSHQEASTNVYNAVRYSPTGQIVV